MIIPLYTCSTSLSVHLLIGVSLLLCLDIISSASLNIGVQVYFQIRIFSRYWAIQKVHQDFFHQLLHKNPNNQPNQILGRRSKQTFLQRKHRNGQKAHERYSASLILEKGKSKLERGITSPQTSQNDHQQKFYKMLERLWRKENAPTLLVGI